MMRAVAKIGRRAGWVLVPALLLSGCFAKVKELPALAERPTFAPVPETAPISSWGWPSRVEAAGRPPSRPECWKRSPGSG